MVIWASRYDAAQFEDYVASLELVLKESRCIFVQQPPVLNFGLGLSTVDWLGIYNHRGFNVSQLNVVEKNSFLLKRNSFESKLLTMFGRSERFTFLPTEDVFSLPEGRVRWWDGGSRIYYIDLDHLSAFGVDLLKEKLGAAINAALN